MNIKYVKNYLFTRIGKRVIVYYYGSRNRKERYEGIIDNIYRNVFVIRLFNGQVKCFNYFDIITGTIKIFV